MSVTGPHDVTAAAVVAPEASDDARASNPLLPSATARAGPMRLASALRYVAPRRDVWRTAVREFFTVLLGVLVALGGQAWWQHREEVAREAGYLRQLLADARDNERRLNDAIAEDSAMGVAANRVMATMLGRTPLAPPDSVVAWIITSVGGSEFRPLAGTYQALIGTGDLRLVRNDSLRALLTRYAAQLESETARLYLMRGAVISQVRPLGQAMPFIRGVFLGTPRISSAELERLRRDPEVATMLFALQAANANRLSGLRILRKETVELRTALEGETEARKLHAAR